MQIKMLLRSALLVAAVAIIAVSPTLGADALAICNSGQPYLWPANGAGIPFNPDLGNLRDVILNPPDPPIPAIDNATGVALVQAAFDNWTGLGADVSYLNTGPLPVDVDISNFGPYLSPAVPDTFSAIVFDADGAIFDLLFGPGSGILGFAGPEWLNPTTCEILEGVSFLNGPAFGDVTAAEDVMTHEFGHYSNLGHVELNGQLIPFSEGGDDSGPSPDNATFGTPVFGGTEVIETMYPFYFGPTVGTLTPHADDIASMATLYPDATFFASRGSISGTIYAPNGTTPVSGVNVIARNVADPFVDAVSTFSGAYTNSTDPSDPNVGVYTLNNLTPGATYAVFIDQVTALAGRFSNPIATLLGPEEWYDANESDTDPQASRTDITVVAGSPQTGIDIIFNQPQPGEALQVGDDGFVQIFMPFTFCIKGYPFDTVFINANGNLTFGVPSTDFSESVADMLDGPARIAGVWDDLSPFNFFTGAPQGEVTYDRTASTFTVYYTDVPEFVDTGVNTFSISFRDNSHACVRDDGDSDSDSDSHRRHGRGKRDDRNLKRFKGADVLIEYDDLSAIDGLAGVSGGLAVTAGTETESDLTSFRKKDIRTDKKTAVFERFEPGDPSDLAGRRFAYAKVGKGFKDKFKRNNSLARAARVELPFSTLDTKRAYSAIDPPAGDIDYYEFDLEAGTTLVAEIERGQIDSVMGLWRCPDGDGDSDSDSDSDHDSDSDRRRGCRPDTAEFITFNDDKVPAVDLLSAFQYVVPADGAGTYAIGVTFYGDLDFDGVDPGQGMPYDGGRYVLDLQVVDGVALSLGDDDAASVPFGFTFPFQGIHYTDVFVNSNGNLTFGSADTFFIPYVADFLAFQPRVSPLWEDLNPAADGFVFYEQGTDCLKVTFQDVPEFPATGANTFAVIFDSAGNIQFDYGALTATGGLAGITEGGGVADPGESDLTAGGPFPIGGTTYEYFSDAGDNDLANTSVTFRYATRCASTR